MCHYIMSYIKAHVCIFFKLREKKLIKKNVWRQKQLKQQKSSKFAP